MTHDKYIELRGAIIAGNGVEALELLWAQQQESAKCECEEPRSEPLETIRDYVLNRKKHSAFCSCGECADHNAAISALDQIAQPKKCECPARKVTIQERVTEMSQHRGDPNRTI